MATEPTTTIPPTRLNPEQRRLRSQIGNAVLQGRTADAAAARRALELSKLETTIKRLVDAAPPLTESQRARLAAILLAPSTSDGEARS